MIKAVNVGTAYKGLSLATVASGSELIFLTGHCPTDQDGNPVAGSFEEQVRLTFENISKTLAAAGTDFSSITKFNVYMTKVNSENLAAFKAVRNSFVNLETPPAFTVIGVNELWDPAIQVEIDGTGILDKA